MKRQQRQLFAILIVLALCVVAYFAVSHYAKKTEENKKESETQEQITLLGVDPDAVDAFTYTYDGTTYSYKKRGEVWSCENDTSIKLDTDSVKNLLGNVKNISAQEKLEKYDSLSDYGLDEPQNTLTFTCDKHMTTLYIGNYNDMLGEYYLKMEGDDNVYLIDSGIPNAFSVQPESMATQEETETE